MVDGFVRWCAKGTAKVGLSQKLELVEANDEVPTGLYDGFYLKIDQIRQHLNDVDDDDDDDDDDDYDYDYDDMIFQIMAVYRIAQCLGSFGIHGDYGNWLETV